MGKKNMKSLNNFKLAILVGAAWGFLTYALYNLIIVPMPLPCHFYCTYHIISRLDYSHHYS